MRDACGSVRNLEKYNTRGKASSPPRYVHRNVSMGWLDSLPERLHVCFHGCTPELACMQAKETAALNDRSRTVENFRTKPFGVANPMLIPRATHLGLFAHLHLLSAGCKRVAWHLSNPAAALERSRRSFEEGGLHRSPWMNSLHYIVSWQHELSVRVREFCQRQRLESPRLRLLLCTYSPYPACPQCFCHLWEGAPAITESSPPCSFPLPPLVVRCSSQQLSPLLLRDHHRPPSAESY